MQSATYSTRRSTQNRPKLTDLKLLAHREKHLRPDDTLEALTNVSMQSESAFFAVLEAGKPVGLVARRVESTKEPKTGLTRLAEKFAKQSPAESSDIRIREVMITDPVIVAEDTAHDRLFDLVFEQVGPRLMQAVILVRSDGSYFGLLRASSIFRLLHGFSGKHLRDLRVQKEQLAFKNQQVSKVKKALEVANENLASSRDKALEGERMKGFFLANMSHEIRTPMNGVFGMLELMLETDLDEDQRQLIGTARSSAETLMRIINDILDFSKFEAGKVLLEEEIFEPMALVESSITLYLDQAGKKGIDLKVRFEHVPEWVSGDPHRYQQVLNNLISNAIKFTDQGFVEVIVSGVIDGLDKGILTEVNDSGIGIPQDKIQAIFEPFTQADVSHQRNSGGTGLGLSISRNLVQLMGGELHCEARPGGGSIFSFVLPFDHVVESGDDGDIQLLSDRLMCKANVQDLPTDFKGVKVLLVEDDLASREVARRFLAQLKCEAKVAENGQVALEFLRAESFDCVLMDCHMPHLDGWAATRAIRSGEAGAPNVEVFIAAATAHAMAGDRERCLKAGMDYYFSKPYCLIDLRKALANCLKQPAVAAKIASA